jgi:predicted porin
MKKSLIALAALAASGFAMAQSSVTLFGVVDTGVTYVDGAQNWSGLTSGNNSTSRLGFRGTEDLGGGLKANFWLEAGLNADNGDGAGGKENGKTDSGLEFKRRSTIGLEGGFGEVRLGRELTAAYNAVSRYDVFGTVGVAQSRIWGQAGNVIRGNNLISYYTPNFSGFKAAVNYGFGEQTENRDGRYFGASLTYDNGPLSVGFGGERLNRGGAYHFGTQAAFAAADITAYGIGASYKFGAVKLAAAYRTQENKLIGGAATDRDAYLIGLSAPVGAAGEVKVSYNRYETEVAGAADQKTDQLGLGYVHSLSKRTAVYSTYAYIKNKNGAGITLGNGGLDSGKQHAI